MKPKKSYYPVVLLLSVAAIWLARELIAVDWSRLAPVIATPSVDYQAGHERRQCQRVCNVVAIPCHEHSGEGIVTQHVTKFLMFPL